MAEKQDNSATSKLKDSKDHIDVEILGYFIELCMVSLGGAPNITTDFTVVKKIFEDVFQLYFEFRLVGSTVDRLYLPKWLNPKSSEDYMYGFNTDIDTLFIPTSVYVSNDYSDGPLDVAVIQPTDFGTFVKLQYNDKCQYRLPSAMISDDGYISSKKVLEEILHHMDKNKVHIVGPSLQTQNHGVSGHLAITSSDRVFAFKNKKWPKLADEWLHRERSNNWPSVSIIEEISSLCSHVVPKGNPLTLEQDLTWRISFNMAERYMADMMTLEQKKCIVALKSLIKRSNIEVISSYHIKSTMWWMVEQGDSSVWKRNVGYCFLEFIDELIRAIDKGVIRNYFMPNCNMIQAASSDELQKALDCLQSIRKRPLFFLTTCPQLTELHDISDLESKNKFNFAILKDEVKNFKGDSGSKTRLLETFCVYFYNYGRALLRTPETRENGFKLLENAACISNVDREDFIEDYLFKAMHEITNDFEFYFAALTIRIPIERIIEKFRLNYSDDLISTFFHDAGCTFNFWANISYKNHTRISDLERANLCFKTSIRLCTTDPCVCGQYAYFLLNLKYYNDALSYAEDCLRKTEGQKEFQYLFYSKMFSEILDARLMEHVRKDPNHVLTVPCDVIAHHVIILANKMARNENQAFSRIGKYYDICLDERNDHKYDSLVVYGYSCMEVNLYDEAIKGFEKAVEISRNEVILDNIETCRIAKKNMK
ncbi:uncharacterized protein LOC132725013 [Ruditapes philippinarum]|uniref:uncharacterized protein LOC132725013 n=1 Tax=Ruditapes philippinarum TaxID=129788 RepID=UPI00295B6A8C|nr:uncharacterized protein LOC132725013 [Ruditapes philippinarum]